MPDLQGLIDFLEANKSDPMPVVLIILALAIFLHSLPLRAGLTSLTAPLNRFRSPSGGDMNRQAKAVSQAQSPILDIVHDLLAQQAIHNTDAEGRSKVQQQNLGALVEELHQSNINQAQMGANIEKIITVALNSHQETRAVVHSEGLMTRQHFDAALSQALTPLVMVTKELVAEVAAMKHAMGYQPPDPPPPKKRRQTKPKGEGDIVDFPKPPRQVKKKTPPKENAAEAA